MTRMPRPVKRTNDILGVFGWMFGGMYLFVWTDIQRNRYWQFLITLSKTYWNRKMVKSRESRKTRSSTFRIRSGRHAQLVLIPNSIHRFTSHKNSWTPGDNECYLFLVCFGLTRRTKKVVEDTDQIQRATIGVKVTIEIWKGLRNWRGGGGDENGEIRTGWIGESYRLGVFPF